MNTLKELAASAHLVSQTALERALSELKGYIDAQDDAYKQALQSQLNALIGSEGDADKLINTFTEIKNFLADYSEDDTLKSLLDAVNNAVGTETARAKGVENELSGRIKTLEDISVMTAAEAKAIFDSVFNS